MNFTQRYQPGFSLFDDIDRFFGRQRTLSPESVHDAGDAYIIRLDLPGFAKSEVTLKVTDRLLQLTAEAAENRTFTGKVERQWKLGAQVDPTGITANLENGVIEIHIPKAAPATPETLEITIN